MTKKKLKIAVAFAVVSGVLIWLLLSGFNNTMQYFRTIEEVTALKDASHANGLRVKGDLVSGSLVKNQTNLQVSFRIADEGHEMEVHYDGILPDTFKDGAEVLVEGKYNPAGFFEAQTVMAKCPSKYESTDGYGNVDSYNAETYQPPQGTN